MTAELWLHKPCEHGLTDGLGHFTPELKYGTEDWCVGGVMVRLDPGQVVSGVSVWNQHIGQRDATVADIIDALDQEEP